MSRIRFSVVIILYNQKAFIAECIESILNQSYKPYEIIIINDGSTDGSEAIVESYQAKYPEMIRMFTQKNQGEFMARVSGMRQVQGDYFLFMDSDDCLRGDSLAILYEEICKTQVDMVAYNFTRSKSYDIGIYDYSDFISNKELKASVNIQDYRRALCSSSRFNSMCTKCIRTACIKGQDIDKYGAGMSIGADKIHSLITADLINTVTIMNDSLYFYRLNPTSRMSKFKLQDYDDHKRLLQATENYSDKWFDSQESAKLMLEYKFQVLYFCVSTTMHKCKNWNETVHALDALLKDNYWYSSLEAIISDRKENDTCKEMVFLMALYKRNYAKMFGYYLLLKIKSYIVEKKQRQ